MLLKDDISTTSMIEGNFVINTPSGLMSRHMEMVLSTDFVLHRKSVGACINSLLNFEIEI